MNKKSFTLIELLVVIAIIGILSSLVIGRFSDWGENARISNTLQWSAGTHRVLGAHLVGHWPLNEGSEMVAKDVSGYDNHGTMHNFQESDWDNDGVPGTGDKALGFDYNDQKYVEVDYDPVLNIDGDATTMAWINWSYQEYSVALDNLQQMFYLRGYNGDRRLYFLWRIVESASPGDSSWGNQAGGC
jgi:prepilin-type N-terminal cleavage/methylation domain-containing protein